MPPSALDVRPASAAAPRASAALAPSLAELRLEGCDRLFIDGGSNTGEAVDAFLAGNFFGCAMAAPYRVYPSRWPGMTAAARRAVMEPLSSPASWCVRSFEAAPELMPPLRAREADARRRGFDVRFVDAALGNVTAASVPLTLVRYARNPAGVSATTLRWGDAHIEGRPPALSQRSARARAFSLVEVLRAALRANASAVLALRLDVEGGEWWLLEELVSDEALLCQVSYLFVEYHGSATDAQRAKLPSYGLPADLFETTKRRVHAAMERPGCRLQINWRSFWASCGDEQRFIWRDSAQATE